MSKKRLNIPTRATNYQSAKPFQCQNDRFFDGSGFQGDIRFKNYIAALKRGDLVECDSIRKQHSTDYELISKCNRLEREWLIQMVTYLREIQIARREVMGWKALTTAYKKYYDNGDRARVGIENGIIRGNAIIKQAEEAKSLQPEISVPSGFPKPPIDTKTT